MEEEHRDWAELPVDLLDAIRRRFTKLRDFTRFQAVCKRWRKPYLDEKRFPLKFRQSLPLLALSCKSVKQLMADRRDDSCYRFIDVTAGNNNDNDSIIHIDLADEDNDNGRGGRVKLKCLGSAFGWLLVEELRQRVKWPSRLSLLNPLTGNRIYLPLKTKEQGTRLLRLREIARIVMSAEPTAKKPEECIVVVLRYVDHHGGDGGIAVCKLGWDQSWTLSPFPTNPDPEVLLKISSMVFWKGKLHLLSEADGSVLAVDDLQKPVFSSAFRPENSALFTAGGYRGYCLVVSPAGELMVLISSQYEGSRPRRFGVYRINEADRRWDEVVEGIGDYALFYDSRCAVFVPVEDHPECKRNCVYHKQDIYDLGTRMVVRRSSVDHKGNWILPSRG